MTITFTTNIESVNTYKVLNNLETVVYFIKFNRHGISEDGYEATYQDWHHFNEEPNPNTFIPYTQLTESQMIDWINAARPDFVLAADQYINMKIEEARASNIIENNTLPWNL